MYIVHILVVKSCHGKITNKFSENCELPYNICLTKKKNPQINNKIISMDIKCVLIFYIMCVHSIFPYLVSMVKDVGFKINNNDKILTWCSTAHTAMILAFDILFYIIRYINIYRR